VSSSDDELFASCAGTMAGAFSFAPLGLDPLLLLTHALRRGLHSSAASRLRGLTRALGGVPGLHDAHNKFRPPALKRAICLRTVRGAKAPLFHGCARFVAGAMLLNVPLYRHNVQVFCDGLVFFLA
jgi:hypothetical protein